MKSHLLVLAASVLASVAAGACSSKTPVPIDTTSTSCSASIAGVPVCYEYQGLGSQQWASLNSNCTSSVSGTVGTSCPSASLAGCCTTTTVGTGGATYTTEECYYEGDAGLSAAGFEGSCSGTWSTSIDGGSGNGESTDGGSSAGVSTFCVATVAGTSICSGNTGLTSQEEAAQNLDCTNSLSGTVVPSCPTANLAGCCTTTAAGRTTEDCYYGDDGGVDIAAYQSACSSTSGIWATTP